MGKYKVIYHIGDTIDIKTKVDSGFVIFEDEKIELRSKTGNVIADFANMTQISLFMQYGVGSMLKTRIDNRTVFLSVVRFCIAGQFAVANAIGTRKLKVLLESRNSTL